MPAVDMIEMVLRTNLLSRQLISMPSRGATDAEIAEEENLLGRTLCDDHVAILRQWNGVLLDIIRFFGCGPSCIVERLADSQPQPDDLGRIPFEDEPIAIGSDPSGFVYLQLNDGRVFCLDTDGTDDGVIAESLDDLICCHVFGRNAEAFAGAEWLKELKDAGIVM